MKCPNCANPEMAVLYERKCYQCGYHQDTADRQAIRALLEVVRKVPPGDDSELVSENPARCFFCEWEGDFIDYAEHLKDDSSCKLAAVIKLGEAVVG